MNILILQRSKYSKSFYEGLLENGHNLYLFKKKERKEVCTDGFKVVEEFDDFDSHSIELKIDQLQKVVKFDRVFAPHEYDIVRAGKIRSHYNIYGQSFESALDYRDKYIMKTKVANAKISVMPFAKVESVFDLLGFINNNGYPVVLKPRLGASGLNVEVIHTFEQLSDWIERSGFSSPGGKKNSTVLWMVEKYVDGILFHVDGIFYQNELICIYPSQYLTPCLAYKDDLPNGSVQLDDDNPLVEKLNNYTISVLKALNTPAHTAFHIELFYTKSNEIHLCEIASRVGGGQINRCMQMAFNVNLKETTLQLELSNHELARSLLKNRIGAPLVKTGFLTIQSKKGDLKRYSASTPFDWVKEYILHVEPGTSLQSPLSVSDYIASVVVVGENQDQIAKRIWEFYDWFWEVTEIS